MMPAAKQDILNAAIWYNEKQNGWSSRGQFKAFSPNRDIRLLFVLINTPLSNPLT